MAGTTCRDLRGRMLLLLLAFGLSPIHSLDDYDDSSSLIEKPCGNLDYEDVDFGGKYELLDKQSNCGKDVELDKVNAQDPPSVTFTKAKSGQNYLIAMVDPDAPYEDNPICRSWLHWIVGNIPGGDLGKGDTSSGETFIAYKPPTPPKPKPGKTNDHRYYIYVFEQGHKLDSSAKVDERKRCHFNIDDYGKKFGLKAVAMNMFKTHS